MNLVKFCSTFPWVYRMPRAGSRWAWLMLYHHVEATGKPAGHLSWKEERIEELARQFKVNPEHIMDVLVYAIGSGDVTYDATTNCMVIKQLTEPAALSESTHRVRRHRQEKRKQKPGDNPAVPAFMVKDALITKQELRDAGLTTPKAFSRSWAKGMNMMAAEGYKDPHGMLMRSYKHSKKKVPCVMTWLNHFVSRHVKQEIDLTEGL